jgi:SRSO17 transposase
LVSHSLKEDEPLRQSETSIEISCPASSAATASPSEGGRAYWTAMARRLAPYCARAQSRDRVLAYLRGVLSAAARKHSGQVAAVCGEPTPYGFQSGLSRADGDATAVRDALRPSSLQPLGDSNGVVVLDETGVRKNGPHAAGVARPSTGTVGTVENGHIGVLRGDASRLGHAVVDRELDVPAAGAHTRERCRPAGIPGDQPLATKPQLACQRLARACAAGRPAKWVTGDRVSGDARRRRRWLEARPPAYVLAVSGTE